MTFSFIGGGKRSTRRKLLTYHKSLIYTDVRGTELPPPPFFSLSVYVFTYLFSIKYLYFFIISTLFPHFNLFVSIFKQSYVYSILHVSTLYILIIHKARNSETFKIVHLLASVTFNSPYSHYIMYQFLKDVHFRLWPCFMHTIAQFSRILRFSLIYCFMFRIVPYVDGSRVRVLCLM
jgi:hypothetical protein